MAHWDASLIPGLAQWVMDLALPWAMIYIYIYGRWSSDMMLLWLWCRPAAAALIQPLACECPYGVDVGPNKEKKKQQDSEGIGMCLFWTLVIEASMKIWPMSPEFLSSHFGCSFKAHLYLCLFISLSKTCRLMSPSSHPSSISCPYFLSVLPPDSFQLEILHDFIEQFMQFRGTQW